MGHKKLLRFAAIRTFPNVLEYPEGMAGNWASFFKKESPLVLELACGKGEYAIGLGELYRDRNFIGVDVKGNRIWAGANKALQKQLNHVAFLRTQIDRIAEYFAKDEVDEIWITFPDPFLRKSKAKKRLTHPKFLRMYQKFLKPGGRIHLKTDSPDLYHFTKTVVELYALGLVADNNNLYKGDSIAPELQIKTYYEGLDIAQSKTVFYICFALPEKIADRDEQLKAALQGS